MNKRYDDYMDAMIKFGDVKISDEAKRLVNECLDTNMVTMGEMVERFEEKWGSINNTPFNIAVNSGSSALIVSLLAINEFAHSCLKGKKIIVPGLTFFSTWSSVLFAGYKPVFCDVEFDSMNIDVSKIEELIDDDVVGIIGVSLMGKPYNASKVDEICKKYDLWHIADNCEAHLCEHNYRRIENFADLTVYSFFAAHVSFSVEQGVISTYNRELDELCRSIRNHGRVGKLYDFSHKYLGGNFKPTSIHSAIGCAELDKIHDVIKIRRENLDRLQQFLSKCSSVHLSYEDKNNGDFNSPHALSIVPNGNATWTREQLTCVLEDENIEWKANFGDPTRHQALSFLFRNGYNPDLSISKYIGDKGIHIGIHQYLTNNDLYKIEKTLELVITDG